MHALLITSYIEKLESSLLARLLLYFGGVWRFNKILSVYRARFARLLIQRSENAVPMASERGYSATLNFRKRSLGRYIVLKHDSKSLMVMK